MKKYPDWSERLDDFLQENADAVFEWGTMDCACWVTAAAQAMTGNDFYKNFRNTVADRKTAAKSLRENGAGTLLKTTDLLFKRKNVNYVIRGDIVSIKNNGREILGIVTGHYAISPGKQGLVCFGRKYWVRGWSVG